MHSLSLCPSIIQHFVKNNNRMLCFVTSKGNSLMCEHCARTTRMLCLSQLLNHHTHTQRHNNHSAYICVCDSIFLSLCVLLCLFGVVVGIEDSVRVSIVLNERAFALRLIYSNNRCSIHIFK